MPSNQPRPSRANNPRCIHCNAISRCTDGREIYLHRLDLHRRLYYICDTPACGSYVGTHRDGKALGQPANQSTRKARQQTHAAFDPHWKDKEVWQRKHLYHMLADAMGLTVKQCHIGRFTIEQCSKAMRIIKSWNQ